MNCQSCGKEVRPNSKFCHSCGSQLANPKKGGDFIRVASGFAGLSILYLVFDFVEAILTNKLSLDLAFTCFQNVSILVFFALIYSGYQWAIYPIGLSYLVPGVVIIIYMIMQSSFDVLSIFAMLLGILSVAFGIYLMRSKDVQAFIKETTRPAG